MTVEVYKPVLKPRLVQSHPQRFAYKPQQTASVALKAPTREVRESYKPVQPRLDLVLAIEDMTHPNAPSFAELEAVVLAEQLAEAQRSPLP